MLRSGDIEYDASPKATSSRILSENEIEPVMPSDQEVTAVAVATEDVDNAAENNEKDEQQAVATEAEQEEPDDEQEMV